DYYCYSTDRSGKLGLF
nr:immunoglobulin light chain junction region [Macaca mulatta]MOW27293.1 immunoglobulin light chain junction region [Macaca mulatta]MOW27309.1 immunoglobulin light chain junction region [Macaca mulatta]MOW27314.1 immunoglobulin light chain junction region [Macaca mulatta]MOW27330.1 immunoglobulin light chain junction region [Macaca mulatta]